MIPLAFHVYLYPWMCNRKIIRMRARVKVSRVCWKVLASKFQGVQASTLIERAFWECGTLYVNSTFGITLCVS